MLMDSVTVLLHRLGVAYKAIMNPVFGCAAGPTASCWRSSPPRTPHPRTASTRRGSTSSWRGRSTARPSTRSGACCPASSPTPARWRSTRARWPPPCAGWPTNSTPIPRAGSPAPTAGRRRAAALAGRRAFRAARLSALPGARREASVDPSSRLGVLRLRDDVLPQLTANDDLLVLAQATIPSYLRYGAYPYIVVVREHPGASGDRAPVRRPVHRRRHERQCAGDPADFAAGQRGARDGAARPSHPAQLLLDIIQTIPRSELFALSSKELLDMAMAVVDLGSRRRTLLFLRADQLAHFVSCLVYLPRDRYTTAVRLEMQDILVRELGGEASNTPPAVSESPWAVVHFTVRCPRLTAAGHRRLARQRDPNPETCSPRPPGPGVTGCSVRSRPDRSTRPGRALPTAFPEVYKQAVTPAGGDQRHRDHRRAAG